MSFSVQPPSPRVLSDPKELTAGTIVGPYRLLRLLASGGMAHLWAAEPCQASELQQTVAIKVIRPEFAKDEHYCKMFIDEANVAMAIEHPNVCRTLELERQRNLLYMSMEWVAGDSLGRIVRPNRCFSRLDYASASRIAMEALAGLHAAHEAQDENGQPLGVIHRDVSPPNILLSLNGSVKVGDFGIAKARHQLHERTKTGEVKGKFGYLAPEQITGGPQDRRVDVYAMGCVLYVATLGMRPFGNGPDAMPKILHGQFKPPSEIDSDFPTELAAIVCRALSREPAGRFDCAGQMRSALGRWMTASRLVVTQGDIAQLVRERMSSRSMDNIVLLRSRSSSMMPPAPGPEDEPEEPPTASTQIVSETFSDPAQPRRRSLSEEPTVRESISDKHLFEASSLPALPSAAETMRPKASLAGPDVAEGSSEVAAPFDTRRLSLLAGTAVVALWFAMALLLRLG